MEMEEKEEEKEEERKKEGLQEGETREGVLRGEEGLGRRKKDREGEKYRVMGRQL